MCLAAPTNGEQDLSLNGRMKSLVDINFGNFRGYVRLLLGECEFLLGRLRPFSEIDEAGVARLVFVCLGNINRSAFAGIVAQSLGVRTVSIGLATTTGAPAFEKAIVTAQVYGQDLSSHRATDFSDYFYQPGDLLLAMEVRHAWELVRRGIPIDSIALLGHWSKPHRIHIHDPHLLSDRYFLTCFAILHSAVINLVHDLRQVDSPCVLR